MATNPRADGVAAIPMLTPGVMVLAHRYAESTGAVQAAFDMLGDTRSVETALALSRATAIPLTDAVQTVLKIKSGFKREPAPTPVGTEHIGRLGQEIERLKR